MYTLHHDHAGISFEWNGGRASPLPLSLPSYSPQWPSQRVVSAGSLSGSSQRVRSWLGREGKEKKKQGGGGVIDVRGDVSKRGGWMRGRWTGACGGGGRRSGGWDGGKEEVPKVLGWSLRLGVGLGREL